MRRRTPINPLRAEELNDRLDTIHHSRPSIQLHERKTPLTSSCSLSAWTKSSVLTAVSVNAG